MTHSNLFKPIVRFHRNTSNEKWTIHAIVFTDHIDYVSNGVGEVQAKSYGASVEVKIKKSTGSGLPNKGYMTPVVISKTMDEDISSWVTSETPYIKTLVINETEGNKNGRTITHKEDADEDAGGGG